jgi:S-adenosylmethionine:tRNA ribosyltransferase-isomerase
MRVSEFDYELPAELIAQHPAPRRADSRLLHLDAAGNLQDLKFADLPTLVGREDVLILNNTKVIKARLPGRKSTGGKIEVFVERILSRHQALALIRASHPPAAGSQLFVGDDIPVTVLSREEDLYKIQCAQDIATVLDQHGAVPLPPYITHAPGRDDAERYQTVYAAHPGAVAAPTAGLHFDKELLKKIEKKGASLAHVTLHVGAGTFQPVRGEEVEAHRMHKEWYSVPKNAWNLIGKKRVLAVGTTSLRALETAALTGELEGESELFVYPGFQFQVVRRLLTNFHLPKSTLLMLVCAFAGKDKIFNAYQHAIARRYRFFSYGDAMLIER